MVRAEHIKVFAQITNACLISGFLAPDIEVEDTSRVAYTVYTFRPIIDLSRFNSGFFSSNYLPRVTGTKDEVMLMLGLFTVATARYILRPESEAPAEAEAEPAQTEVQEALAKLIAVIEDVITTPNPVKEEPQSEVDKARAAFKDELLSQS